MDGACTRREANCTLPANSGIAATDASWHNNEALADLRHGIFVPV
jgi:hypothetical protein